MGWEFYDREDETETDDREPSFSLYDFKKWLASQHVTNESTEKPDIEGRRKEKIKEAFKEKMLAKVQKNIEKKMRDR